jgi:hypothetical protein
MAVSHLKDLLGQNWTVSDEAKYCICQASLNRIYWQNSVNSAILKKGLER